MILPSSFEPLWEAPAQVSTGGLWFVFHRGNILIGGTREEPRIPEAPSADALPVPVTDLRFVGLLGGTACWAARTAEKEAPAGFAFEGLRSLFNRLPDEFLAVGGRAIQVLEFDRTQRYCGACATPTVIHEGGRSRKCPNCGETGYARVAPAMMVLIKRDGPKGRELLMARSGRFVNGMYSALAGFIEPSESIEDCIHREVFEEVGVKVSGLRYYGSQGWPFPHSLMIAFVADYIGGDIVCQEDEIEDARWFTLDDLPVLPNRLSIARRLVNAVIGEVDPNHPALKA
ncbi:MAG TPA: NAD(+) diphosphatase [Burkholderiales bacterium]|jgi:NAD+ diphosphatase|nr:NAD(+) diphosphatase [Burkholderiales bacterium]